MCREVAWVGLLTISAGLAGAHDAPKPVLPSDYFSLAGITEFAISPDASHVAYSESRWDPRDQLRRSELWVVPVDRPGMTVRLTSDRANARHLRWAADGSAIYFLANRKRPGETKPPFDGSTQIWRVLLDGSEPRDVTQVDGGVSQFDYATKADQIIYSVDQTIVDQDEFSDLRQRFTEPAYGHGRRLVSTVVRLDPRTWRTEELLRPKRYVRELAITPDGQRIGMITAQDDSVIQSEGNSRVEVWRATTRTVTPVDQSWRKSAASPWPWLESLAWDSSGQRLAYCSIFDGYPAEIILQTLTEAGWSAKRVKRPEQVHVHGYGSPLRWSGDKLLALGEQSGTVGLIRITADGVATASRFRKGSSISAVDRLSESGEWVVLENQFGVRPRLRIEGRERPLVDPNGHTATWALPTVEHLTWKSADGTTVGGPLELPVGWKPGDPPLPLVVAIHGGPTTSSKADLLFDPHNGRLYFSAAGYAVLCPNYRGSTGYGDQFVTDLLGRENELDVADILAGIQHLVANGIADPKRVGVMGWSNGGYLTNCLITKTDSAVRIRAASSGAGILDTVAEWGFNDEPAYPMVLKKGLPWETPEIYRKTSPTYALGQVRTPTLIHVGSDDVRCPPGHSRMLYRALREYVQVPTELVVYPGEPHGLSKRSSRQAKMEWDLAWFKKYLNNDKK